MSCFPIWAEGVKKSVVHSMKVMMKSWESTLEYLHRQATMTAWGIHRSWRKLPTPGEIGKEDESKKIVLLAWTNQHIIQPVYCLAVRHLKSKQL